MFSKIWLVNLILALFAAFFGLKAYGILSEGHKTGVETRAVEGHREKVRKGTAKGLMRRPFPPESAYAMVVSKNLFSPERSVSEPGQGKQDEKDSLRVGQLKNALKRITLYGVVITDDYRAALVTSTRKKTRPGRRRLTQQKAGEKQTKWVRKGDTLSDFEVAEIMEDRILLKAGSKSYDLLLYDKDRPKIRVAAKGAAKSKVVPRKGRKLKRPKRTPVTPPAEKATARDFFDRRGMSAAEQKAKIKELSELRRERSLKR
jgi:hypothetical protein